MLARACRWPVLADDLSRIRAPYGDCGSAAVSLSREAVVRPEKQEAEDFQEAKREMEAFLRVTDLLRFPCPG